MKYRRRRKAKIVWSSFAALAIILFLVIFFGRKNVRKAEFAAAHPRCEIVRVFPFSGAGALKGWEEKIFKNKVIYRVESDGGLSYVRALSDNAASALYYRIDLDAKKRRPVITWSWRAEKFPAKSRPESLEAENEDDFAARVYVIFPAVFITNSKVLEYVWSQDLPAGSTGTSPYSKNIKLMVLEQGLNKEKRWFFEERDICSDYVKLFGRPPEHNIGAIAFMTNTEHTATAAEAMYGKIELGYSAGTGDKEGGGRLEN